MVKRRFALVGEKPRHESRRSYIRFAHSGVSTVFGRQNAHCRRSRTRQDDQSRPPAVQSLACRKGEADSDPRAESCLMAVTNRIARQYQPHPADLRLERFRLVPIAAFAGQQRASGESPRLAPGAGGHCLESPHALDWPCDRPVNDADPLDSMVLEGACQACRRGEGSARARGPNMLVSLMRRVKNRTQGLALLTGTPMRVHPLEVSGHMTSPGR